MAAVEMVISAGATGPPIRRFENAPPNVMVCLRTAASRSISASASGVEGCARGRYNPVSGKPLLYAGRRRAGKAHLLQRLDQVQHELRAIFAGTFLELGMIPFRVG